MCDFELHEELYSAFEGKVWRWRFAEFNSGAATVYHRSTRTVKKIPLACLFKSKADAEKALVAK